MENVNFKKENRDYKKLLKQDEDIDNTFKIQDQDTGNELTIRLSYYHRSQNRNLKCNRICYQYLHLVVAMGISQM